MRGLSLKRCLELAKLLGKRCAALRDIDDNDPANILLDLGDLVENNERELFIGSVENGKTLEPQLITANTELVLRTALGITPRANVETWMTNNKTEAALKLAEYTSTLNAPDYFSSAIEFIHDA